MLLVCLAVVLTAAPSAAQYTKNLNGACASPLDCVLNGDCVSGQCVCVEGWTGKNCQQADLLPSDTLNGFGSKEYPTWWCARTRAFAEKKTDI